MIIPGLSCRAARKQASSLLAKEDNKFIDSAYIKKEITVVSYLRDWEPGKSSIISLGASAILIWCWKRGRFLESHWSFLGQGQKLWECWFWHQWRHQQQQRQPKREGGYAKGKQSSFCYAAFYLCCNPLSLCYQHFLLYTRGWVSSMHQQQQSKSARRRSRDNSEI